MPPIRPWLVMVTGEPGSGKTTLVRAIGEALRLPFLRRAGVRGGQLASDLRPSELPALVACGHGPLGPLGPELAHGCPGSVH